MDFHENPTVNSAQLSMEPQTWSYAAFSFPLLAFFLRVFRWREVANGESRARKKIGQAGVRNNGVGISSRGVIGRGRAEQAKEGGLLPALRLRLRQQFCAKVR